MIQLILPSGEVTTLTYPKAGKPDLGWLAEQSGIPNGYLEFVSIALPGSTIGKIKQGNLVVHEEGRLRGLPFNAKATEHYARLSELRSPRSFNKREFVLHSPIVGPALLLTEKDRIK